MGFSHHLFRGTQSQARDNIQHITKTQGSCIVNFVYFAQAMHYHIYQNSHYQDTNLSHNTKTSTIEGAYLQALQNADIVCIDGIAMQLFDWIGQIFFKDRRIWTANLNGTDFLPYILSQTSHQKVGIIMSTLYDPNIDKGPEWMYKGLQKLKELYLHIDIIFSHQTTFQDRGIDFPFQKLEEILAPIRDQYEHVLFLNGIGGPIQEIRTDEHHDFFKKYNLIVMNNGATLDYYSGFETRAPQRVVKLRIGETLWRVITQPQKNLKKFIAMFRIIQYRYRCLCTYVFSKKLLKKMKTSGKA